MEYTQLSKKDSILSDTAKITFTSGSTGTPKGVCLSLKNMDNLLQSLKPYFILADFQRHGCLLPFSVLLENITGVYLNLMLGRTLVIPPFIDQFLPFHVDSLRLLTNCKIHSAILVPEFFKKWIQFKEKDENFLNEIKFLAVGGAKVSSGLLAQAKSQNIPLYEGYGLSENASVVSLSLPDQTVLGYQGKILPHVKAYIDETGELIIQEPNFLGYLGQPQKGPFHTGDEASINDLGYLKISGRKKNIIINSLGRNISPEWIESELLAHPSIIQALVYGEGKDFLSALIVSDLSKSNLQAIVSQINSQLPEYAQIYFFEKTEPFTVANGLITANGRMKRESILTSVLGFNQEMRT